MIYGRSDSTINRGGVRMGTSELYSAIEGVDDVLDSLVVDVDDRILLFVVDVRRARRRAGGRDPHGACASTARRATCRTPIYRIDEVPRTLSNKKLEVPVKRILQGGDPAKVASRDSLANPAALDWFAERAAELTSPRAR